MLFVNAIGIVHIDAQIRNSSMSKMTLLDFDGDSYISSKNW